MDLAFFTMPLHPPSRDYSQTLREDREAVILADLLSYTAAFVGEHVTDLAETITSPLAFLASLADATQRIQLGTGTLNLPNHHPARLASEIAMVDHLLGGRLLLGIGPGGLRSDAEIFGNLDADRTAMFVEAIDAILALWTREPPYDVEGKFWRFSTRRTHDPAIGLGAVVKPLQRPHPPIFVTVLAPFSKGVTAAAERGWRAISGNFLQPAWVASHWPMYAQGRANAGAAADPREWWVARSIFVAEDAATARRYAKSADGPYGFYFDNLMKKVIGSGRAELFKHDRSLPDSVVTLDYVLDSLVIAGTPDSVVDQILSFRERVGDFGTLVYVGHDWADPALARRSMALMAEKVMPAVNAALGR
jgi:alkanesulfonate monooxygenase SsuD/methylene tetrahydromethanopterin reductase-like flavin-dependent oxidoreductase (luciferase family)